LDLHEKGGFRHWSRKLRRFFEGSLRIVVFPADERLI
jgi:hypothetical protein